MSRTSMSFRTLVLALSFATFFLTLAILHWQERRDERSATASMSDRSVAPALLSHRSRIAQPVTTTAAPAARATGAVSVDATSPQAAAPIIDERPEVPVMLSFRFNRRQRQYEGQILNQSSEPLAVSLEVQHSGAAGDSQVQLNLEPNGRHMFGAGDGVNLQGGDKVTVQNDNYRSKIDLVPGGLFVDPT